MSIDTNFVLKQLDEVIAQYQYDDLGKDAHGDEKHAAFNMRCIAAIRRFTGPSSDYAKQANTVADRGGIINPAVSTVNYGIIQALRADVVGGYLSTLQELIHASLFSDYLEMADYLLSEGWKDAAAVMVGGTLEEHLRQLCLKHSVPVQVAVRSGTAPKKAEVMNVDLRTAGVYTLLEQQSVTSWLVLRNLAAHGKYTDYDAAAVANFLQGVRNLISKYPA